MSRIINSEQLSYLELHAPGLNRKDMGQIRTRFGSFTEAARLSTSAFQGLGLIKVKLQSLAQWREPAALAARVKLVEELSIEITLDTDPNYPDQWRQIPDPPIGFYLRGQLPAGWPLAIVGSRRPTDYGQQVVQSLLGQLASSQSLIISGLAYGIDQLAHRLALQYGLPTLAVLGTGLDTIYPAAHRQLANLIIDQGGGLVSEFPLGSRPYPGNFPVRNQLIAGLAEVILVVEGSQRSGSLITGRLGADYGRDVWALPGDINRPNSAGPNRLISEGAYPYCSPASFLGRYQLTAPAGVPVVLDQLEQRILKALSRQTLHLNDLAEQLALDIGSLSSKVIMLEIKGQVFDRGEGYYSSDRAGRA